ncbi:amidohydrolase family protein [Rhizobium ruizarguesonis]|uniref:amidohydrolase family protein n=1 Tax=Rhizobium ruizarguesonis TaxID=2081791 RepID=UPI0013C13977|nr:amidohydrolase family protein [Rhizobium ruizarguesonis]MBC2806804.1 amidohydrolase [Rhizobium ruizarguesonis]NEI97905.1 amidohydrolase family protein [Rhizobium ruizarguesonis]NEJ34444.1 amidohydrolase family protein [Rhizobium ruizarguesonis]
MNRVIDLEISMPESEANPRIKQINEGRPGTPFAQPQPRPEGYGFSNYKHVFKSKSGDGSPDRRTTEDGGLLRLVADMDLAGISQGLLVGAENDKMGAIHQAFPGRFFLMATFDPKDGMRAVREFERLVRDDKVNGLRVSPLYNGIPANDRRYYPLYAKCVELDVPVRIYTSMNYANDRPYDLGHPRHLDDVAVDFPELRIVAGLAGWPWVNEMVALLRRHPRLYADTAAHHPRYFGQPGSGWEQFLQFGNTLLQDKIMVGLSRYLFAIPFEDIIEAYRNLPLKEKVVEKWLYGNAVDFFRLN